MEEVLKRIILENQEIISGKKLISRNYSMPETDHISRLPAWQIKSYQFIKQAFLR